MRTAILPIGAAGWIEDWLARHRGRSANTAREYAHAALDRASGVVALVEQGYARRIGLAEAEQVAASLRRRYGPSTVSVTLSALSSLWRELMRQGIAADNPWREVGREVPRATLAERITTEEETASIIAAAPPGRERTLVRTLYLLGARASELAGVRDDGRRGLCWRDVGESTVTLFGKGQKTRTVRGAGSVVAELRALPGAHRPDDPVFVRRAGGPMTRKDVWTVVTRAARAAGVRTADRPVSPHWLRHDHVTDSLRHGAPIHVVQQTVGHASLETTGEYAHLVGDESSVGYVTGEEPSPARGASAPGRGPAPRGPGYRVRGGQLRRPLR